MDQTIRHLAYDAAQALSADRQGNIYVTVCTEGGLSGPSAGGEDAFLSKYDANGNLQWIKQFGGPGHDFGNDVSADGLGNVYVSGQTEANGLNKGNYDVYIRKFDAAGNQLWAKQLGTPLWDEFGAVPR